MTFNERSSSGSAATPDPGPPVTVSVLLSRSAATLSLVRSVETNSGALALYADETSSLPEMVIKNVPSWTATHASGLARTLDACRLHSEAVGARPFVATLHGWGDDPVFIATGWIEGENLNHRMADELAGLTAATATAKCRDTTTAAAALVARFHRAMADSSPDDWGIPPSASGGIETGMAARLISALRGSRGIDRSERVRSIDDPGPHNTILDANNDLWLIDLPADFQEVMVERDIARLVSRVVGAIHRASTSRWVPYHPVVDAVIAGYERDASPSTRRIDRSLVYACLAADAAVKVALTRRRLPPGTRLECFFRESFAALTLGGRALRLRITRSG